MCECVCVCGGGGVERRHDHLKRMLQYNKAHGTSNERNRWKRFTKAYPCGSSAFDSVKEIPELRRKKSKREEEAEEGCNTNEEEEK